MADSEFDAEDGAGIETPQRLWYLVLAAIAIVLFVVVIYFAVQDGLQMSVDESAKWGQMGDFFGGILNPALSFISLIALLLTISYQVRELSYTRRELQLSRREISQSSLALQSQEASLRLQNFENTFFNLLSLLGDIKRNLYIAHSKKNNRYDRGDEVFEYLSGLILDVFQSENLSPSCSSYVYEKASLQAGLKADHYFMTLVRIFRFIDSFDAGDKALYIEFLKAQLSAHEVQSVFFYGLSESGTELRLFIERFAFFEDLDLIHLPIDPNNHGLYSESAYQEYQSNL